MLSKVLFQAVLDEKSSSAKRAFAASCAVILKYASPSQAQKLIEDTAALHLGDRNSQISCATLLKSYSSLAVDVVSGYHTTTIPVIFLSRYVLDILSYYLSSFWNVLLPLHANYLGTCLLRF